MKIKRTIALLLISAALMVPLTACQNNADGNTVESSAVPVETLTPTPSPVPQTPDNTQTTEESVQPAMNEVIVTANSIPVYWEEFRYWMNSSLLYAGIDPTADIDWSLDYEGVPLTEYVLNEATEAIRIYRAIETKCAELNVGLSETDKEALADVHAENVEYYGSEEAYQEYLDSNLLTKDLMEYMITISCLYYNLFTELYGEDGAKCSDADVMEYAETAGIYRAKHILLRDTDMEDNPLSEEEKEANYAFLEDLLVQLDEAEDPVALFDELMLSYSEDPGVESYPDGYQFRVGDMTHEFQSAVESLEDYGYSSIVHMGEYGYTIIMRLPLDPDGGTVSNMYGDSLRSEAAVTQFELLTNSWMQETEIVPVALDGLDPAALFPMSANAE